VTNKYLFTSESVSEGHPDKVSDQISDAILDAHLKNDPASRIAVETLVKNSVVVLAGEVSSNSKVDYEKVVREVIRDIGYQNPAEGFDSETCEIITFINSQSADISMGVNEGSNKEQGAGDQGLMFGFACDETPELMPLPIALAHKLTKDLATLRKSGKANFLRPDSKAQVTVEYQDGKPHSINTIVISTQHTEDISLKELQSFLVENFIKDCIPEKYLTKNTSYLINPTGRFIIGGPVGDCGLTGRKVIVDTYGGYSRHGGGAFSGKDPSKVDRSATYAARQIAKNIVKAEVATKCEVQLAYAIGVAKPVSTYVDTFGTGKVSDEKIAAMVQEIFNLTPKGIIESLNLLKPIYRPTATYGHFGRTPTEDGHFSWEKTDMVKKIQAAIL